jgi:hypothetical protein
LLSSERGELTVPGTSTEPDVPTFYSKAEMVANEKVPTAASGDQILATLRNNGVKENEIGWMGLDDYLKGKPRVSKTDLQQYIKENQIQLKEVDLGEKHALLKERDSAYVEQNKLWQGLKYGDKDLHADDVYKWIQGSPDEKAAILQKASPETAVKLKRFDELGQRMNEIDSMPIKHNPTKFEQYTLPGEKSNYSEKLLTLPLDKPTGKPTFSVKQSASGHDWSVVNDLGGIVLTAGTPEYAEARAAEMNIEGLPAHLKDRDGRSGFRSSHFGEPNVLAHVRYDDRPALDGKKTLFLEELQSDWHQKGKIEGYQNPAPTKLPDGVYIVPDNGFFQVVNREGNPLLRRTWANEADARTAALQHYGEGAGNRGVPDAPFKSDWHELAMKRMLRHAAENGYDRIAWTTGDQQAARYDLSRHVSKLEWHPVIGSVDGKLWALDHTGHVVMQEQIHPSQIADYVGKDAAQKLLDAPLEQSESGRRQWRSISGVDLKVGGNWAKALYDRAIPNFLRSYTKKWGAKVGTTQLRDAVGVNERYDLSETSGGWRLVDKEQNQGNGTFIGPVFKTGGAAETWLKDKGYLNQTVHSIEITPAMRKSLMKTGQPIAKNTPQQFDWTKVVNS